MLLCAWCRGAKPLPPEPGRTADLPLYCTAFKDKLTIFRDLSGTSLHRRGYRRAMHRCAVLRGSKRAHCALHAVQGWRERGRLVARGVAGLLVLLASSSPNQALTTWHAPKHWLAFSCSCAA